MARFYSNENVALPVVVHLRQLGHDVVTSHEAGRANQKIPDADVLRYAYEEKRVLLTNNRRDFLALHREGAAHCGIVVFTSDARFAALAERIDVAIQTINDKSHFLIRVNREDFSLV